MSQESITEEQSTKKKTKKAPKAEMSFLDHLETLRWHIIKSAIAICLFATIAFIYTDFIFDSIIFAPKEPEFWTNRMIGQVADFIGMESLRINTKPLNLISIEMAGQFMVSIWTAIIIGSRVWRHLLPAFQG